MTSIDRSDGRGHSGCSYLHVARPLGRGPKDSIEQGEDPSKNDAEMATLYYPFCLGNTRFSAVFCYVLRLLAKTGSRPILFGNNDLTAFRLVEAPRLRSRRFRVRIAAGILFLSSAERYT